MSSRLIGQVAIIFAVFVNVRSLSLLLAAMILVFALPLASRERLRAIARHPSARGWGLLMAGASAVAAGWALFLGQVPTLSTHDNFTVVDGVTRTWQTFEESVAWFGVKYELRVLPPVVIFVALWAWMFLVGIRAGDRRDRALLLGAVFVSVGFPIVVSLLRPAPIYTIWEGRYSLPFWVGVPILAGTVAATTSRNRRPISSRAWLVVVIAFVIGHVVAYMGAARRYAVGAHGSVIYVFGTRWQAPVPQLVLLEIAVGACALLAWRLVKAHDMPGLLPVSRDEGVEYVATP